MGLYDVCVLGSLLDLGMSMTRAVLHVIGMIFELMNLLYSLLMKFIELRERWFICTGDMLFGPNDLEGFEFVIDSVLRLWSCLSVVRLIWSEVKFVGLVKYLLKAFDMFMFVVLVWLLKVIYLFWSERVSVLLFNNFMVF